MRRAARIGPMACIVLACSGCSNDYDGLLPGSSGAGGAGPGAGSTGSGGAASSASTGVGGGGATSSSASVGGAASSASTGGAGAGGVPQGGDGGTGGAPDPLCGNGALDPLEECDGGTPANNDGCSSKCKIEGNPMAGCETQVEITAFPLFLRGDTSGGPDFTEAPGCFSDSPPDAVFRVVAPGDGVLSATVATVGDWNGVMALRGGCGPGDGYCAALDPEWTIDRSMSTGATAHVLVTGAFGGDSGPYLVTLTFE